MSPLHTLAARRLSSFALILTVILAPAHAAQPAQPEPITIPALRELLTHEHGDVLVQFTSTDQNCGPCIQNNNSLPGWLDRDGWKGRFLRVAWAPWQSFPSDLSTLPGMGQQGGVPFVAVFRNGQLFDGVEGQNEIGTQLLIRRLAAPAAPAAASPPPLSAAAAPASTAAAPGAGSSTTARAAAPPASAAAASTPPAPKASVTSGTAAAIASLSLEPATLRHLYGAVLQLRPQAQDAGHKSVTPLTGLVWSSSDPTVASVDPGGRIHLLKRGKATITASAGGVSAHASVDVLGFSELARTNSNRACALPDDRDAIYCWGKNLWTIPVGLPGTVHDVAAPTAINRGELPTGVRLGSVVVGTFGNCALTQDGRVFCWGNSQKTTPLGREPAAGDPGNQALAPAEIAPGEAPPGTRYRAIGVGPSTACAAGQDHKLYCWGDGNQLPQPPTRRSAGRLTTPVGIPLGELPASANVQEIALSTNGGCVLADGDVYCWHGTGLPKRIPPGEHPSNGKFTHVDSDDFVCALGDDGAAYCTGSAFGARFGRGTAPFLQTLPWLGALRTDSAGFSALSQGGIAGATCALDPAGQAWCWGKNHMGSAAAGRTTDVEILTPQLAQRGEIPPDVKLVAVSCGQYHCIALGDDGRLYAWGSNEGLVLGREGNNFNGSGVPIVVAAPAP